MSRAIVATVVLALTGLSSAAAAGEPFEAGVAVVDITPLPGCRMCGYFNERINTGTRDPLLAKAIVFRQGSTQAALVMCDLEGISPEVSQRARQIVERLAKIPAANVAIAATHSHTGPLYHGSLRQHFHDRAVAQHGSDPYEGVDYPTELIGRIVRAILVAQGNLQAVTLTAGYALEDRLSFNRRSHMKQGPVVFNPGHLHPDIVRPAGPIDPQVGIVMITPRDASQPTAAIVSFALHLDTLGGTLYSADFPRYVQDELRGSCGDQFVSLFAAGTCGDINHIDVTKKAPEGRRKTDQIGTMLAETVAKRLPGLKGVATPSLAVRHAVVETKLQKYSPEQVARAKAAMEFVGADSVAFLDQVEACKIVELAMHGAETMPLDVQAFRLSRDVAIVTLPGEVFVDLGLAVKRASPFETTLVIELANAAPGYIPTSKAFAEGSYETVNSQVVPGSGEELVKVASQLLQELAAPPEGGAP